MPSATQRDVHTQENSSYADGWMDGYQKKKHAEQDPYYLISNKAYLKLALTLVLSVCICACAYRCRKYTCCTTGTLRKLQS